MSSYLKFIGALYACDYVRRLKRCRYCDVEFSDITKRNLRNTCSDQCDVAMMVATRKLKGNYVQTEDSKIKKSISVRATYASRDVFTVENRAKFSETLKKTWVEGKIDTSKHWSKTPEGRQRLSQIARGKIPSIETRRKMSIAAQARLRSKREVLYTSARGGFRDDLGQYFRSSWEANFARILTFQGKSWEYEPKTFQLTPTLSYTPDFFCDEVYYEIKGRMSENAQLKLTLMTEYFPNVKIKVVDGASYQVLRLQFKHLLPTWEGK